jgi:pimeloyl-ACP methyl ester carboxylesterase
VGKSSSLAPTQSCTLRDQIDDLEALRVQLAAERIDLLGHSWGGCLAMAYAARYPQRIQHLLIVDSGAPKSSDTVYLFKDVFPEGVERQDAAQFATQMGDGSAAERSLPRRILPFRFRRQPPANRGTIRLRLAPRDANHRQAGLIGTKVRGCHDSVVGCVCDLGLPQPESARHLHKMAGTFVGLALRVARGAAHSKCARQNPDVVQAVLRIHP